MRNIATRVPFVDLKAQYSTMREEINAAILRVVESAQFVGGQALEQFEQDFAAFIGARYCVGVANGTDAITLAAKAAGIGSGDEVLVPANSFFATAEAISNTGAIPVFVDVDPVSFHMDPGLAALSITARTKAIVPVHLYGRPVNMQPFEALASRHNLVIIEDCAQAHGASSQGKIVGSSGRLTCYSFYPAKNLGAYGDGGAVTTNDPQLRQRIRTLREHGSVGKYLHSVVGYNSRLDALQAAVLSVKLPRLLRWNAARRDHARRISAALEGSPIIAPSSADCDGHANHLLVVRCTRRDELIEFLAGKGIQTGIHYPIPLHLTAAYQETSAPKLGSKPVAETLASEILSLPMYAELSEHQISLVIAALKTFIKQRRPSAPTLQFSSEALTA